MRWKPTNDVDVDRYKVIQLAYRIMSEARGLGIDGIPIGSKSFEELLREADKLAATSNVMEWDLAAHMAALIHEHPDKIVPSKIKELMELSYNYRWREVDDGVATLERMTVDGAWPEILHPFALARGLWGGLKNRGATTLSPNDRITIWELATNCKWRVYLLRHVIRQLLTSRKQDRKTKEDMAKAIIAKLSEVRDGYDEQDFQMAGRDSGGEGEEPERGPED